MDNFQPPFLQSPVGPTEWDLSKRLGSLAYDVNRGYDGVEQPQLDYPDTSGTSQQFVYAARLVLQVSGALSGLYMIDGFTPVDGDVILTAQDEDTDGLYAAHSGAWTKLVSIEDMPFGALVSVFNGVSTPMAWSVTQVLGSIKAFSQLSSYVSRLQIQSINPDVIVCYPYASDGTVLTGTVFVARPTLLRCSLASWNAITYTYSGNQTRLANNGSATETQVVVPAYTVGTDLYAAFDVQGTVGTCMTAAVGGSPIPNMRLLDLNVDGRAWAKQ